MAATVATKFVPSNYQQAFFNWITDKRGSCVLIAVAGSGKTKSIERALPLIPERFHVQLFAFNTTIGTELGERIELLKEEFKRPFANVRAGTFHKVGFAAVCRCLGNGIKPNTDSNKLRKLCREWLGEAENELYGTFICKLVGLAKGEGIGAIAPDTEERWWDMVHHHDLFLESEDASEETAVQLARQLLQRSNAAAKAGSIDFDDMLYLPLLWRLRLWQNDWVFVDEAQDTNPVRRAIAKLALTPGGRLVAVGDPRQAIYGFTGASHDAIDLIKREFNAIELPLTISYRCSKAVVRHAQELVPYMEAHADNMEGKVADIDWNAALKLFGTHDAIICRNTAPLLEVAYSLVARSIGCTVLGREIGAGLVDLVKRMKAKGLEHLEEKLEAYRDREVAKCMARGEEQKAEAVTDRVSCVFTVINHLPETTRTVPALIGKIEGLFSDSNGVLTLCTGHKSKGKEYKRVFVLRPELMPSKWARQDHQRQQEENLMYVVRTRAMEELYYLCGDLSQAKANA